MSLPIILRIIFTFPHNIEYPGTMTEHIHYEAQLKVDFREFVRKMKETHAHFQEVNMRSADEICAFIKKMSYRISACSEVCGE